MKTIFIISFCISVQLSFSQTGINTPWTWVNGDSLSNQESVYGALGVPDPISKPAVGFGSTTWIGSDGSLWLFVGTNHNTLWKYNPAANLWTWLKGGPSTHEFGIYGTQGVPAPANTPGSRQYSCGWTDINGNLWLFGGSGYDVNGSQGELNDLWKYDPAINQWTWIKGSNITGSYPVYGSQGIPAASNMPGSRDAATSWTDASGDFWMFGGEGELSAIFTGYNDQLWKYTVSTNQWTWMKGTTVGDSHAIYGTQLIPDVLNKPSARAAATPWIDASGNFWMFGGYGVASVYPNQKELNDLWKYSPSTNEWTYMKGDSVGNLPGVYGIRGVADILNYPGGRDGASHWKDVNGNFWLMGGTGLSDYDDLWKYDVNSNNWTWVKGDSTSSYIDLYGIYGNLGVAQTTNKPGGRFSSACWTGELNNFWMLGGYGYAAHAPFGTLNDLWKISGTDLVPLTLINFSGSVSAKQNYLYWQTKTETNTREFTVERSMDAINFSVINHVAAAGNSSLEKNYVSIDPSPLSGINYYRLKMIDIDNKFTYSNTIALKRNANNTEIFVFPNPTKDVISIQISTKREIAILQIIDVNGKKVIEKNIQLNDGNNTYPINISNLNNGIYDLLIRTRTNTFQQKFVKQ